MGECDEAGGVAARVGDALGGGDLGALLRGRVRVRVRVGVGVGVRVRVRASVRVRVRVRAKVE